MRTFCLAVAAAIVSLPPSTHVHGQDKPTFSANSEVVVLHVTVRDKKGAYVGGLTQDAFNVIEDGRAQTVSLFSDTDTPATIGMLIDSSGSMHQHRGLTISGATAFTKASHPQDEIFAIAFNEYVMAVLPASSPFTSDDGTLRVALERNVNSRGRTALYDAIVSGVEYLSRGTRERKVLVLLSDGGDNASRTTRDEAVHKAQASNAVIYTIGLIEPDSRDANPGLLKELSLASGGELYRPRDFDDVADVLDKIARDIRHTYTIGYTPTNTARDGAFRTVRVVVTAPPGRSLVVRSRTRYRAGTSPR
ncbi:MAG TPA: VWA domain-containing protein [Vicinamibacterales bacterium]|nr:VWA domain-containing protein [Vicinamibacterales bacterium]